MQVIVTDVDKLSNILKEIQRNNPTSVATLIPETERIFEVDLSNRKIQTPEEIITVQHDHNAETIYFKINRFFDNTDLSKLVCVIEYITPAKESFVYPVPYYDIDTLSVRNPEEGIEEPMILIPWIISGVVAENIGTVQFAIRFFKLDTSGTEFIYNLTTLPTTLQIVKGLEVDSEEVLSDQDRSFLSSEWEHILDEMKKVADTGGKIYWTVL